MSVRWPQGCIQTLLCNLHLKHIYFCICSAYARQNVPYTTFWFFSLKCAFSLKALIGDNKEVAIQQIFISARSFPFQYHRSDIFQKLLCSWGLTVCSRLGQTGRVCLKLSHHALLAWQSIKQKQHSGLRLCWSVWQTAPPSCRHVQTFAVACWSEYQRKSVSKWKIIGNPRVPEFSSLLAQVRRTNGW